MGAAVVAVLLELDCILALEEHGTVLSSDA